MLGTTSARRFSWIKRWKRSSRWWSRVSSREGSVAATLTTITVSSPWSCRKASRSSPSRATAALRSSPRGRNAWRRPGRFAGPPPSAKPGRTRASTARRSASSRATRDSGNAASSRARTRTLSTSPVGAMSQPPNVRSPTATSGSPASSQASVTRPRPAARRRAIARAPRTTVAARLPWAPTSQTPTLATTAAPRDHVSTSFDKPGQSTAERHGHRGRIWGSRSLSTYRGRGDCLKCRPSSIDARTLHQARIIPRTTRDNLIELLFISPGRDLSGIAFHRGLTTTLTHRLQLASRAVTPPYRFNERVGIVWIHDDSASIGTRDRCDLAPLVDCRDEGSRARHDGEHLARDYEPVEAFTQRNHEDVRGGERFWEHL